MSILNNNNIKQLFALESLFGKDPYPDLLLRENVAICLEITGRNLCK